MKRMKRNQTFKNKFHNGTNALVKIFNQKCVICLEEDSVLRISKMWSFVFMSDVL